MKGSCFLILTFFTLAFCGTEAYGQAVYTSKESCEEGDFVAFDTCWAISGGCVVDNPVVLRPIPPYVEPELIHGANVIIEEAEMPVLDENFDPVMDTLESGELVPKMIMVEDYIINADGVRLDTELGESVPVFAGYTVYYGDGRVVEVAAPYVEPDPVYEIGGTADCPLVFEINHEISTGNLHLKDHVTIKVNEGGNLNIDNLSQKGASTVNIIVDGGEINMNSLVAEAATINKNNSKKTELNITLNNGGGFNVNGLTDLKNNVTLTIDGDGSSMMITDDIAINQGVIVNIEDGGGLKVNGATRINGNSSGFNIKGHFETESLNVSGGQNSFFNAIGDATVNIENDVEIRGRSTNVTFGGDSEVQVGGDFYVTGGATTNFADNATAVIEGSVHVRGTSNLNISDNAQMDIVGGCVDYQMDCEGGLFVEGDSKVDISKTAEVYVCGQRPIANNDENLDVTLFCDEVPDGEEAPCATYAGCRLLPVNIDRIQAVLDAAQRVTVLSWSTAKEWENSHFEIERSVGGVKNFEKIGEVAGMGWSDRMNDYSFEDESLPLKGGNVFYRLKQVDFNGKFEYSEVLAVRVPAVHITTGVWRAYPNPTAGGRFHLELVDAAQYQNEEITLRVLSSTLHTPIMTFKTVQDLDQAAYELMSTAPRGLWILELQWGNKVEHLKVMKK
jgi:hypothetical protein